MQRWMRAGGTGARVAGRIVRLLTASAAAMAAAACLSVAAAPASAQEGIKAVTPYVVVVTMDHAPMRCSNGVQLFYPVRELKAGELLRVNGEGPGWLRVAYTPGMQAYVTASEVQADRDGKTVKLTRPSRLLAVNAEGKRPWWPLELDADIPAGTVFKVVKAYSTPDGMVEGYYVEAPPKARGYVKPEHVRKATPEEAAKYAGEGAPPAPGAGDAKSAETKPQAPAGTTTPHAADPGASGAAPLPPAGTTPATPGADQPAGAATVNTEPPPVAPAPPPAPTKDEEIEQIRTMFNKVMQSSGDVELPTVIGMFEQKMAKLGDSESDKQIKTALQQRLDALKLRQDVINQLNSVKQYSEQQKMQIKQVALLVEQAQKQAIYNIVGRIQPSTVYDGSRGMPLMYRIESADALSPRTVGYIVPVEGMDLLTKIGKVCGVVGENRFDPSLQLNIVSPRRIDVLDVGATSAAP